MILNLNVYVLVHGPDVARVKFIKARVVA